MDLSNSIINCKAHIRKNLEKGIIDYSLLSNAFTIQEDLEVYSGQDDLDTLIKEKEHAISLANQEIDALLKKKEGLKTSYQNMKLAKGSVDDASPLNDELEQLQEELENQLVNYNPDTDEYRMTEDEYKDIQETNRDIEISELERVYGKKIESIESDREDCLNSLLGVDYKQFMDMTPQEKFAMEQISKIEDLKSQASSDYSNIDISIKSITDKYNIDINKLESQVKDLYNQYAPEIKSISDKISKINEKYQVPISKIENDKSLATNNYNNVIAQLKSDIALAKQTSNSNIKKLRSEMKKEEKRLSEEIYNAKKNNRPTLQLEKSKDANERNSKNAIAKEEATRDKKINSIQATMNKEETAYTQKLANLENKKTNIVTERNAELKEPTSKLNSLTSARDNQIEARNKEIANIKAKMNKEIENQNALKKQRETEIADKISILEREMTEFAMKGETCQDEVLNEAYEPFVELQQFRETSESIIEKASKNPEFKEELHSKNLAEIEAMDYNNLSSTAVALKNNFKDKAGIMITNPKIVFIAVSVLAVLLILISVFAKFIPVALIISIIMVVGTALLYKSGRKKLDDYSKIIILANEYKNLSTISEYASVQTANKEFNRIKSLGETLYTKMSEPLKKQREFDELIKKATENLEVEKKKVLLQYTSKKIHENYNKLKEENRSKYIEIQSRIKEKEEEISKYKSEAIANAEKKHKDSLNKLTKEIADTDLKIKSQMEIRNNNDSEYQRLKELNSVKGLVNEVLTKYKDGTARLDRLNLSEESNEYRIQTYKSTIIPNRRLLIPINNRINPVELGNGVVILYSGNNEEERINSAKEIVTAITDYFKKLYQYIKDDNKVIIDEVSANRIYTNVKTSKSEIDSSLGRIEDSAKEYRKNSLKSIDDRNTEAIENYVLNNSEGLEIAKYTLLIIIAKTDTNVSEAVENLIGTGASEFGLLPIIICNSDITEKDNKLLNILKDKQCKFYQYSNNKLVLL